MMLHQRRVPSFLCRGVFWSFCMAACGAADASGYQLIHVFAGAPDGGSPQVGLVKDSQGRLYGTTDSGGAFESGSGTVFRLTKPQSAGGLWAEEILHSFSGFDGGGADSPLTFGSSGEIYGTTVQGGSTGHGVVYRLDNVAGWPVTVLHSFGNKPDGAFTQAGVFFGLDGLLYGTAPANGYDDGGIAFSVSPLGDTTEYAIIHKFGKGSDGCGPRGLAISHTGKMFGVTGGCSLDFAGTAFSLRQDAPGEWREATLLQFGAAAGVVTPEDPAMLGKQSFKQELFGCGTGGAHGEGVVYTLTPSVQGSGPWTETVLYNFGDQPNDPVVAAHCNVIQGPDGKLFGMADSGGIYGITQFSRGYGAFFELDPPSGTTTTWQEIVLHNFNLSDHDGAGPVGAPLLMGGSFYGSLAATKGGYGAIFKLTP